MECVAHATLTTLRHVYGYTPAGIGILFTGTLGAHDLGDVWTLLCRFTSETLTLPTKESPKAPIVWHTDDRGDDPAAAVVEGLRVIEGL